MKKLRLLWGMVLMGLFFWGNVMNGFAMEAKTIYNSPYVTFSPDQKAWTTNAGDQNYVWYDYGTTVSTGISSKLRELKTGEHYYRYARTGIVPIGKWSVKLMRGHCTHNNYISGEYYHGISFRKQMCLNYYYSGWMAYCADCGEITNNTYFYMSRAAAASIDCLELGTGLDYYYLCPHCRNLEQGIPMGAHMCKRISPNQYRVVYDPNTEEIFGGYMADSIHMYDNAEEYEGEPVTPVTHLTKNAYTRIGYVFVEWNTEADGTGICYEDGAEILNLTDEDKGQVRLYAQWKRAESTLIIDPAGGSYDGNREVTLVTGEYGSVYTASVGAVQAPEGFQIFFEVGGGKPVAPVTGKQHFAEWCMTQPFHGQMEGELYRFTGPDGSVDTITAIYEADPVLLPNAEREGYSFGGWYYDSDFTRVAGGPGDSIVPTGNTTLYAQWTDLMLFSEDNYTDNDGKGAVDLSWSQSDGKDKTYLIYQSMDGQSWERIYAADQIDSGYVNEVSFAFRSAEQTYEVPYTGLYTLTAQGAQGGGYESFSGGPGGSITAVFWLDKGEILTFNVGGQDGYHGGGSAAVYGNGGGCTTVLSDQKGTLLIAGGGGGASENGDGGAGGSEAGVTDAAEGESGMAGGGGGYQGGAAGEHIIHNHDVTSDCYHAHTGNSTSGGGCYGTKTVKSETRICTPARTHADTATWPHNIGCGGTVTMLRFDWNGTNGCTTRHSIVQESYCTACGYLGKTGSDASGSHTFTYTTTVYELDCGRPSGYFCGYEDGQIVSSKPAYGGSSYVNMEYAYSSVRQMGVNLGDGSALIRAENVGFMDVLSLSGVTATDLAAPERISENVSMEPEGDRQVKITWRAPQDRGTEYFHVVESFLYGSEVPLCRSNITHNTLTSGVSGYYCVTDESPFTTVSGQNGQYTAECVGRVSFDSVSADLKKYLHVAAVDLAGNVGETTHILVESGDVAWKLWTGQLQLESGDNVYPAGQDETWYVRSDGKTPFTLEYQAYQEGPASLAYQLNYAIFEETENTARNILYVPSQDISEDAVRTEAAGIDFSQRGETVLSLYPYSVMTRSERNRQLTAVQQFVIDPKHSGERIDIIPVAGADRHGAVVYSDKEVDLKNGITVIADGEAPVVYGLEFLENRELIDRRDGDVTLTVTAADTLSGVKELYVGIFNTDNGVEKLYRPGQDGCIRIEITEDQPVFSGDFTVTAFAADNVGNVTELTWGTTEFSLEAEIERILAPHDPVFKGGESGILTFSVWGYADRVEVEFPEEMAARDPQLNRTFLYTDQPAYFHQEQIQFMIPVDTPVGQGYTVIVRAYKGDRKLEEYPAVSIVQIEGTVLDEFRTRLR